MLKIRRSRDRLIFNMEILYWHHYIETTPRLQQSLPDEFTEVHRLQQIEHHYVIKYVYMCTDWSKYNSSYCASFNQLWSSDAYRSHRTWIHQSLTPNNTEICQWVLKEHIWMYFLWNCIKSPAMVITELYLQTLKWHFFKWQNVAADFIFA